MLRRNLARPWFCGAASTPAWADFEVDSHDNLVDSTAVAS
jgi:hypothetical protein